MRILYVEDDLRDADITIRWLRKTAPSIEVELAPTFSSALVRLERLASAPLDLVLTDIHLRDGDGLSLLKHIRENALPVAVVIVTGMGDEDTAVAAFKARADDYVVKRSDYLDRLPATLESALNNYRAESAHRARPLQVLYAEHDESAIAEISQHISIHADHVHLNVVSSAAEALYFLQNPGLPGPYVVLLLDFELPELNALDILRKLRTDLKQDIPVVLICSQSNEELASQCLKRGATSYVVRRPGYLYQLPWELEDAHSRAELLRREAELEASQESLRKALDEVQQLKDQLQDENVYLKEEIRVASNFGEMIGQSEALTRVLRLGQQVAPLDTTVLILGETGTGKELLAHAIHNGSPRQRSPLVKVNCAALPADLIESELFGHEKGAFTGANVKRKGRFEIANGGTIFLDEVGELPLDLQTKLLRVLQEGEFEPVGSSRTVSVDVRIIAATNRNLTEAVRDGTFRSDLFYRLNIFPITLPALRERKNDIPLLVRHFVKELSRKFGKEIDVVPQETMTALRNYPWPGNIRELRNVIERAVITTQGSKLHLLDGLERPALEPELQTSGATTGIMSESGAGGETLEQSQYNLIVHTLKKSYWRIEGPYGAAAALKVHPSKLRSMMKKLGIKRPEIRVVSGSDA
jgi:DNA-binding NtrC family response regulator